MRKDLRGFSVYETIRNFKNAQKNTRKPIGLSGIVLSGGRLSYNVNVNSLQTTVALCGIEGNFLAIL